MPARFLVFFLPRFRQFRRRHFRKIAHVGEERRALCAQRKKPFIAAFFRLAHYEIYHSRAHVVPLIERLNVQARKFRRALRNVEQAHERNYAAVHFVDKVCVDFRFNLLAAAVDQVLRACGAFRKVVDGRNVVAHGFADFLVFVGIYHRAAADFFEKLGK